MGYGPGYIELIDLVGPYAGKPRKYSKTAGENAIASGFADYPENLEEEKTDLEADGQGNDEEGLPADMPGRTELLAVGLETMDAVRAYGDLLDIEGIGAKTVQKILVYIEER